MQEYLGPEIISHFVMHATSIAEIVKNLIAVMKKKDDDVPNIFLEALRRVRLQILEIGELHLERCLFCLLLHTCLHFSDLKL